MATSADDLAAVVTNSDAFYLDPNAAFDRPRPAAARSEYGVELLSYPRVREAFRDKRLRPRTIAYFERLGASEPILDFLREGNLMTMTPEKHDRIRAIMIRAFTPARIEAFRPRMRGIADELIDGFADRGEGDLVADFCHLYPISVLAQMTGVPAADVSTFAGATIQLRMLGQIPFLPGMPLLEGALRYLYDYVETLVARRRAEPADDFVGALIALKDAGERLSEEELVWGIVFLMLGGHDTTRFTLAGCLRAIVVAGKWEALAAAPSLIPDAIAEGMRVCPGTPRQMRVVDQQLEIAGVALAPGEVVSLNLNAAGRDPAVFDDAATFRCPRRDPAYDIGFGFGRHACLGQLLARAEMAEAVARLTARLTDVAATGPGRLKPTGVIGGFDSLPVRFAVRAA